MLQAGGNAVDAAVAAALAVGVVEPFSSGIGGGGYAVAATGGTVEVVAFPMQACALATPARYPLDGRANVTNFLWQGVVNDANVYGYDAMAIPGAVAGLSLLLRRRGLLPWREVLQPAIRLARDGCAVEWYTAFALGRYAAAAARAKDLARIFYPGGVAPQPEHFEPPVLRQPELAGTLDTLARDGPDAFYRGDIAQAVADDCAAHGGVLRRDDLAQYEARIAEPLRTAYRGAAVYTTGPGSAGPTTAQTLRLYERLVAPGAAHGAPERLHAFLWAARLAQADRFAYMADPERQPAPWAGLVSDAYAAERARRFDPAAAPSEDTPGDAWAFAGDVRSERQGKGPASTTHLCAADREGGMVALTNTLMSAWGSEVVPQGTGIVWNNGMLWFDPVPGRPASIAPRARGLNNMSPLIVLGERGPRAGLGASGGRRITNCVCQLIVHLQDFGLGMQAAIAAPRVDASTPWITVDARFGDAVVAALRNRGWDVRVPPFPEQSAFASPVGIVRDLDGTLHGGVDVFHSAEAWGW